MSNLNNNRLNVSMTPAQITAVKTALQNILTNMPFLTGLTPKERMEIPKINVSNKVFVEDTLIAASNNPELLPAYMSVGAMQTDLSLFEQLDEILKMAQQLTEKLSDTQMLAGSEAYISALAFYRLFAAASAAGVQGADSIHDELKKRFTYAPTSGEDAPQDL